MNRFLVRSICRLKSAVFTTQKGAGIPSVFGQNDKSHADCHQQHAKPTPEINAFVEENNPTESAGDVTERSNGNNEADVVNGQGAEKGEKCESHHADAGPHPRLAQRP